MNEPSPPCPAEYDVDFVRGVSTSSVASSASTDSGVFSGYSSRSNSVTSPSASLQAGESTSCMPLFPIPENASSLASRDEIEGEKEIMKEGADPDELSRTLLKLSTTVDGSRNGALNERHVGNPLNQDTG